MTKDKICPKILIISMFKDEAEAWHGHRSVIDLESRTIPVPGLPIKYPEVHCTADGDVCQAIIGMGLINAALSIAALLSSDRFDFSKTHFLIAGIGGINPSVGTLGSVILAHYAIQVDLQYEIDAREIPAGWNTGYFPQGSHSPNEPPKTLYGTEVFELNCNLRNLVHEFGKKAHLEDSPAVRSYCTQYAEAPDDTFEAATNPPSIIKADVTSSNVFFHGSLLSEAFSQTCKLFTDGSAVYGITAQEDNGTLAALFQGASQKKLDFSRIILMRTASNFDQPPAGELPEIPLHHGHGGFPLAVENIYRVGIEIVRGILEQWDLTFEKGVPADNHVGDILGVLDGSSSVG